MAIKLYHGSNVTVSEPKILESSRALDFGNAFYMTSRLEQAKKWARLTAERRKSGTPVVADFDFDDDRLGKLNVIRYMSPDREWLKFVSGCRTRKLTGGEYDVIIGPVATTGHSALFRFILSVHMMRTRQYADCCRLSWLTNMRSNRKGHLNY